MLGKKIKYNWLRHQTPNPDVMEKAKHNNKKNHLEQKCWVVKVSLHIKTSFEIRQQSFVFVKLTAVYYETFFNQ